MLLLKRMLIFLIISSLNVSYAQEAVPLKKGDAAPFAGVLLSNEKANFTRLLIEEKLLENASLNRSILLYKKNTDISEQQINNLLEQNSKLVEANNSSSTKMWLIIGVTILGTLGAVYAGKQVTR